MGGLSWWHWLVAVLLVVALVVVVVVSRQARRSPSMARSAAPSAARYRQAVAPDGQVIWVAITPRTSSMAIAAFVVSLFWFVGVASLIAVILAYAARRAIRRTGEQGDGFAIAGLALGYIGIAGAVVFWVLFTAGVPQM